MYACLSLNMHMWPLFARENTYKACSLVIIIFNGFQWNCELQGCPCFYCLFLLFLIISIYVHSGSNNPSSCPLLASHFYLHPLFPSVCGNKFLKGKYHPAQFSSTDALGFCLFGSSNLSLETLTLELVEVSICCSSNSSRSVS